MNKTLAVTGLLVALFITSCSSAQSPTAAPPTTIGASAVMHAVVAAASPAPVPACDSSIWWVQQDNDIWVYDEYITAPFTISATLTTKTGAILQESQSGSVSSTTGLFFPGVSSAQVGRIVLTGATPARCAVVWDYANLPGANVPN